MLNSLSKKQATYLLVLVIIARSTSYMFSKILLASLPMFNFLSLRFLLAFIILAILFRKKLFAMDWKTFKCGAILGALYTLVMMCETIGLNYYYTSTAAFLGNMAIVFVPPIYALLTKKLPSWKEVLSCLIAFLGVGFLTIFGKAQSFNWGFVYGLSAAFFYSLAIILTGKFSQEGDPLTIGILQVGFIGMNNLILALLTGPYTLITTTINYFCIGALALICTVFGFTLQPVCQEKVDTNTAGAFCAISPCSCTILGIIILGEELTTFSMIGCGLIFVGIILPYINFGKK